MVGKDAGDAPVTLKENRPAHRRELLTPDLAGGHDALADALDGRGLEADILHEDGTVLETMVE